MSGTKITPELLADLKARAQKATPGEWQHCFSRGRWDGWIIDEQNRDILKEVSNFRENAAFIAAANPAVVLALIEKIERLEEDFEAAARSAEEEADWLAEYCEGEDQCPYLAFQWGDPPDNKRPDWCVCTDTPEDGFDCDEDAVECWRKVAREAVEKENEAHKSTN